MCGRKIHALAGDLKSEDEEVARAAKRTRKSWLALSIIGNLGLLGYFKYANFFIQAFADVAGAAGIEVAVLHLDVVLPLGISFYTFQSMSYTLDIERGRLDPEPSFWRFALFVVFFPQLVAGPIVRARQLIPQLREGPRFSRTAMEEGAFRICKGMAKKIVLGDWIAVQLTDRIFTAPGAYTSAELMLALYAYTLQIYADFSGYSDIAIGVGRLLGFELPENFDRPYQSRDIAEYWRRWHMTLSGWLRDYLFFPLIGRLGARGGYVATWLTMFLVGMWHGASWNFVIYANVHAAAVVFNRWNRVRKNNQEPPPAWQTALKWVAILGGVLGVMSALLHFVLLLAWPVALVVGGVLAAVFALVSWLPDKDSWANTALHIALTFHFVVFSRIFFRSPDLETSRRFVQGLTAFDLHGIRPGLVTPWVGLALVGGLAYHFTPRSWVDERLLGLFRRLPAVVLGIFFTLLGLGLMQLMSGSPRAFIYFQF